MAEPRSLVEAGLGCTPSEEYLQPGEGVALGGLLVEAAAGVVRSAAVEA